MTQPPNEPLPPITIEEAESIHQAVMESFPQEPSGVRDRGLLESALARPLNAALYEHADAYLQAASLIWGLISDHPFHQGNKRTATVITFFFLGRAGLVVNAPQETVLELVYGIDSGWTVADAAQWFRRFAP